ncbi:hypothetical protein MXL26_12675 [Acinetobacter towneri]|uniref:hypothetical protein n=1 Tax=Acinetobacter towneri TaxID=202956 RepID=UPI002DB825CF|nr:hypothetical protein [Acinetobacter towneri]MEB6566188.1 hypothetical protein [Acinetobacter towneri]
MPHDFNKPPHVSSTEEITRKKRIPVFMLMLVGIFLLALLFYMMADRKPSPSDAPPGHPNPEVQQATPNSTTTGTAGDEARAVDSDTATATDQ